MATAIVAEEGITPLFKTLHLRKGLIERMWGLLRGQDVDYEIPPEEIVETSEGKALLEAGYGDDAMTESLFKEADIEYAYQGGAPSGW